MQWNTEKHRDVHLMRPQVLFCYDIRCKLFGKLWLWFCLGRPWFFGPFNFFLYPENLREYHEVMHSVARIARPTSLVIWHRRHIAGRTAARVRICQAFRIAWYPIKDMPMFRIAGLHCKMFAGAFVACYLWIQTNIPLATQLLLN